MSRKRRHKPELDRLHKIPVPNGGNGSLALAVADMQNPTPTQEDNGVIHVLDSFVNTMARLGSGTPNLNETADYVNTRLTRNFMLLTTLYRSHWVIRKIVDVPAEDMCKNWYQFSSDITPEMIDQYQRKEKVTKTKAGIVKGLKWGRLYGGGGAVIMIKGHEDYFNQPLDYETIMPGSYSGLMVFDRWSGIQPGAELIDDLDSPDFGLPRSYTITLGTGAGTFEVHSSRVLRFPGRYLPFWEEQAEINWGVSEIELVFDELKKRDNASWNIASLLFMANIRVMKMGDLRQMLSSGNQVVQSKLYSTLSAQNHLMSNQGMLVLDKDDSYEQHETTGFKGIADVYETFMLDLAGAAEMPVTKLFGRAPAGMNATGESDLQQYYDSIEQKQESTLRPVLDKLMPVIAMSEWGHIPEDLDFVFNPPATVPSDKLAELAAKRTSSVVEVFNTGLISQQIALKELRQMSDETGMWTNITDEEISAADAEVHQPGEMLPPEMEGGAPEGAQGPGTAGPPEPGGTPPPLQGGSDSPGSGSEAPSHDKMLGWIRRMREFVRGYLGKTETSAAAETEDDDRLSDDLRMNTMFARIESLLWKTRGQDAAFREEDHPRDEDGKFASLSGAGSASGSSLLPYDPAKAPDHIKALKIPPAWTEVVYNPDPNGALLVKGKDAKGRVQAIYSARHVSLRAQAKFARIKELDRKFERIKAQNEQARKEGNLKDRADCLALIMATGIRPGSDMDTQAKVKAYGATTLEGRHIQERGGQVWLEFVGKKVVPLSIPVFDKDVSAMLMNRKRMAGDNGRIFATNSGKLLKYTHTLDGGAFKPKDFRTHLGTSLAAKEVETIQPPATKKEYEKRVRDVAKKVARALGNTPTVALQSYINPFVFSAWRKPEWN